MSAINRARQELGAQHRESLALSVPDALAAILVASVFVDGALNVDESAPGRLLDAGRPAFEDRWVVPVPVTKAPRRTPYHSQRRRRGRMNHGVRKTRPSRPPAPTYQADSTPVPNRDPSCDEESHSNAA